MFQWARSIVDAIDKLRASIDRFYPTSRNVAMAAADELRGEWIEEARRKIPDMDRRLGTLEEVRISPNEGTPVLILRLRALEQRCGNLEVALMKQSAKKPRTRKKTAH
jgi:hypothetical protein